MLAAKNNSIIKLLSLASYRCTHIFDRFKSDTVIQIEAVKKDKYMEAVRFMERSYRDDPLLRAIGICCRHSETRDFLSALWMILLQADMSLAAIHLDKIRGLSVNCPYPCIPHNTFTTMAKTCRTEETRTLLLAWEKINIEAPRTEISQKGGTFELAGLAVDNQFRGEGVARNLIESSTEMAMQLGYDHIRIDCSNPSTARLCTRLGWTKIWESSYETFPGYLPDTLGLRRETPRVTVFIKKLEPNKRPY